MHPIAQLGWLLLIIIALFVASVWTLVLRESQDHRSEEDKETEVEKFAEDVCQYVLRIILYESHSHSVIMVVRAISDDMEEVELHFRDNHPDFDLLSGLELYQEVLFVYRGVPHTGAKKISHQYDPESYIELVKDG